MIRGLVAAERARRLAPDGGGALDVGRELREVAEAGGSGAPWRWGVRRRYLPIVDGRKFAPPKKPWNDSIPRQTLVETMVSKWCMISSSSDPFAEECFSRTGAGNDPKFRLTSSKSNPTLKASSLKNGPRWPCALRGQQGGGSLPIDRKALVQAFLNPGLAQFFLHAQFQVWFFAARCLQGSFVRCKFYVSPCLWNSYLKIKKAVRMWRIFEFTPYKILKE